MAGGTEASDRDALAFELSRRSYLGTRDQALQSPVHRRERQHGVGAAQSGADHGVAAANGKLNFTRKQSAHDPRRAAANENQFDVDAVLLKSPFPRQPRCCRKSR